MINLDSLNLRSWEREDIEDIIEELYPNLLEMSIEELEKIQKALYWDAVGYFDKANRIESKADVIGVLIRRITEREKTNG